MSGSSRDRLLVWILIIKKIRGMRFLISIERPRPKIFFRIHIFFNTICMSGSSRDRLLVWILIIKKIRGMRFLISIERPRPKIFFIQGAYLKSPRDSGVKKSRGTRRIGKNPRVERLVKTRIGLDNRTRMRSQEKPRDATNRQKSEGRTPCQDENWARQPN